MAKKSVQYCTGCGCDVRVLIKGARITTQCGRNEKAGDFRVTSVTLAPVCLSCFLKAIGCPKIASLSMLPNQYTECVSDTGKEAAPRAGKGKR